MSSTNPTQVTDLNIVSTEPLPSPADLCREIARTDAEAAFVANARAQIQDIIFGDDERLLVIVGPCSIHDAETGIEYAQRLAKLRKEVEDVMCLVMRVYFEKPRTTVGWKGLIMDPQLDGSNDIPGGLRMARKFLQDVIALGVPTATELLDPITPQYIADLICWSAIGARTTESQTHRQMASGLSMPLGFKNATFGSIGPAINAIKAATSEQTFLGVNDAGIASAVTTKGNPYCHIILRGGANGPNYDDASVAAAAAELESAGLRTAVMVDASHDNSGKDHERQPAVFLDTVAQSKVDGSPVIGSMLESNLEGGNQKFPQPKEDLKRGVSITDKCLDWATTEKLLHEAADSLR
ncbi:MAG: 3-deoxy-7-phosphoheptulonate synthase [Verrucomicrobiota bacterium]